MDRSRQMPNSTEQQSSSDDLIAELARLMAEEAQGGRSGSEPSKPAVSKEPAAPPATPAVGQGASPADGDNVVPLPAGRTQPPSAPAGSVWGRALETPPAANSDQKDAADAAAADAFPSTASQPAAASAAPAETPASNIDDLIGSDDDAFFAALNNAPSRQPDASADDESETFPEAPQPAAIAPVRATDDETKKPADDPIAMLIAEQEREEAERLRAAAPQPEKRVEAYKVTSTATPPAAVKATVAPKAPAKPDFAPKAPEPVAKAADTKSDDDILSVLRVMNTPRPASAIRPEPPMVAAKTDDTFSAAPAFGLGNVKPEPADEPVDPLDEIETLIGDAVRYSRDGQGPAREGTAPEPDLNDAAYAAEAAIAAAAAETGWSSRSGHRHEPVLDTPISRSDAIGGAAETSLPKARPAWMSNNRLIVGVAAAATVLVAVALGLYWFLGVPGEPSGPVPVLTSNTADAKTAPPEQNTTSSETTQPAIFDELDGTADQAPADEQIVSRDQSTTVDTTIRQVATPETAEENLANRKVRTVTVRPDGSIVSNDDTVAANEVLPVTRPNVPTLSDGADANADFQVTAPQAGDATDVAAAAETAPADTAADPIAGIVNDAVGNGDAAATGDSVADVAGETVENAPFPAPRPADSAFRVASAPVTSGSSQATTGNGNTIDLISDAASRTATQTPVATVTTAPAATQAAAPAASAAPATGDKASAYVQLSSQRSAEAANATLQVVAQRYQNLFNGAEPIVRQVDLGDRGIFYRILVPANSLNEAASVCASVKSAGGDCFVQND